MIQLGQAIRLALGAAAASLLLAPHTAPAQNLGRLALLSRLGEPLDAVIEITAVPPGASDSLSAQIVPIGVFERFGVTPAPPVEVVRASVERSADGRPVVRLRSTVPLELPTVNMIVELAWNGGKMVRQYSFNIEPSDRPVAKAEPPAQQAAAEPPAASASPAATPPAPAKPAAMLKEKPAATPAEKPAARAAERPVATPAEKPATRAAERPVATPTEKPAARAAERPAATPVEKPAARAVERPAAKPNEKVAATGERPRAPARPTERDVAAAEDRVKTLERTMRELQEKIDARNREIEALQRQVGGTAK
jgi:Tfp pilus assembly protein FimV